MSVTVRESLDVLEKVANIATLAGINGRVDEERMHFEAGFNLPDNRKQMVYIRPTDRKINDSVVVTFFSPALRVKSGFMKGISKEQAIDLLQKNEQMLFARYGLWSMAKEHMVVASIDHMLDSLDPEEFHAHIWHVAMAADFYEKEHGKDEY